MQWNFAVDDIITTMSKIKLVEDSSELEGVADALSKSNWIGIDTEFLREKTYYPLLCLIQVHSDVGEWCIDTVKIDDLSSFEKVISNPALCKIFHSCSQDLEALERRFTSPVQNLYDTQIAAGFCGIGAQVSYAALVKEVSCVELAKTQTRTDWSARPLSSLQIDYAIDDVRYLDDIRQHMNSKLDSLGRSEWHQAECQRILDKVNYIVDPNEAWSRLKGAAKIPRQNQKAAKALAIWREFRAQKRDRPREWIVPARVIVEICTSRPGNERALSSIDGMSPGIVRNAGVEIIKILDQNPPDFDAAPIWSRHAPMDNDQKAKLKQAMKQLRAIAERENISQSLLANRSDVEAVILQSRDVDLMHDWRYELAGKSIAEILS